MIPPASCADRAQNAPISKHPQRRRLRNVGLGRRGTWERTDRLRPTSANQISVSTGAHSIVEHQPDPRRLAISSSFVGSFKLNRPRSPSSTAGDPHASIHDMTERLPLAR